MGKAPSRSKNANINKPRLERPPYTVRDLSRYPKTMGDEAEQRPFTFEEQFAELAKCAQSCEYFISQYCTVVHPKDGLVPCILYGYQKDKVLPAFLNERFVITRKFRQGGFSTVAALTILWMLIFKTDLKILVVSKGDREAMEFLTLIKHAYDYLPDFLRVELVKRNDHIMETVTGCRVGCYTPKASVSFSCKLMVIDEAAHIEQDMNKVWGKIYPVVSAGGSCWVISTCNGVVGYGEWYYKTWTKAKAGENFFFPLDVAHTEHPDYSHPNWEAETRANIGEMEFRQQYLREFLGVANSIFREELLSALEQLCATPIRSIACPLLPEGSPQRNLMFFEEPVPGEEYMLVADPAMGLGQNDPNGLKTDDCDFATIQILAISDLRQVAEYRNDAIKPPELAKVAMGLGHYYNGAVVVCEAGPLGQAFLMHLRDVLQYDNIYSTDPSRMMGLIIDRHNRPIITTGAANIIEKQLVAIRSIRSVQELRTLVFDTKRARIDHLKGYHDDLFTALAYGYYVRESIMMSLPPGAAKDYKPIYSFSSEDATNMMDKITSQMAKDNAAEGEEPILPSMGGNDSFDSYGSYGEGEGSMVAPAPPAAEEDEIKWEKFRWGG